uniref:Uncharacterized protein n=1 Tax=Triticum urartu TaxID=4572 RepID=A0A8R7R3H5_TRIUA
MVKRALSGDMGGTFPHIYFISYHSIYFASIFVLLMNRDWMIE